MARPPGKRQPGGARPGSARETRLAYSTGGETERQGPASAPAVAPGATRIHLDRRASGRVVTLVTGLPGRPEDAAALARELRTACGTGGTFKDGAVELQGDHRERVERELLARGIRSKRAGG